MDGESSQALKRSSFVAVDLGRAVKESSSVDTNVAEGQISRPVLRRTKSDATTARSVKKTPLMQKPKAKRQVRMGGGEPRQSETEGRPIASSKKNNLRNLLIVEEEDLHNDSNGSNSPDDFELKFLSNLAGDEQPSRNSKHSGSLSARTRSRGGRALSPEAEGKLRELEDSFLALHSDWEVQKYELSSSPMPRSTERTNLLLRRDSSSGPAHATRSFF